MVCRPKGLKYKKHKENPTSFKKGNVSWNKGKIKKDYPQLSNSGRKLGSPAWNKGLTKKTDSRVNYERLTTFKKGHNHSKNWYKTMSGIISWNKGKYFPQISGKNHWNWGGGKTKINRRIKTNILFLEWRAKVFKRDNYHCQNCGSSKCYLEVHHIIPFNEIIKQYKIKNIEQARKCKLLWDIGNGITLCPFCHAKIDKYREQFNKKNCSGGIKFLSY